MPSGDTIFYFSVAILGCLTVAFAFLVTFLLIAEMKTDPQAMRHPIRSVRSQIKKRRKKNASDSGAL